MKVVATVMVAVAMVMVAMVMVVFCCRVVQPLRPRPRPR